MFSRTRLVGLLNYAAATTTTSTTTVKLNIIDTTDCTQQHQSFVRGVLHILLEQ